MIDGSVIFQRSSKGDKEVVVYKVPSNKSFEPNVYIYVRLNPFGFFKRLFIGVKYILGITGIEGHWNMMRLDPSHIPALQEIINHLNEKVLPPTDPEQI